MPHGHWTGSFCVFALVLFTLHSFGKCIIIIEKSFEGAVSMKLVTIRSKGSEGAAVVIERGFVRIATLNEEKRSDWPEDLERLVASGQAEMLDRWYLAGGRTILENMSRRLIIPFEDAEVLGEVYGTDDDE